jgi:IS30 family transposase
MVGSSREAFGSSREVVVGRKKGSWTKFSPEMRREVMRLRAGGLPSGEIAARLGVSRSGVKLVLAPLGGVIRRDVLAVSGRRLSLDERVEIRIGVERGWSYGRIGRGLGRSASTICREVAANGGRGGYRPMAAHQRAFQRARRPKATKLAANRALCERVIVELEEWRSPQQIAWRLRKEAAQGATLGMVSHETIYKSLYVQGRGELRRELTRCLRSGRAVRKSQGRLQRGGRIPNMVMISERPAEADDRAVPGHWEGDLLVGKDGKSHIATLVERSSRYVMLAKIPNAKAETVAAALAQTVTRLPSHLWRSLTWDQGPEMSRHELFSIDSGVPVYFCDPHSPWQRGSNENTNGLLRQYFPKGTSLRGYSQEDLDRAAISLNGRPRATLDWHTPAEWLTPRLVAPTD